MNQEEESSVLNDAASNHDNNNRHNCAEDVTTTSIQMRSNKDDDDDDDDDSTTVGPDILPTGSHDVGGELMEEEEEEGEECSYEPESEVVEGTLNVNRRWSQSEFSPTVENVRRRGRASEEQSPSAESRRSHSDEYDKEDDESSETQDLVRNVDDYCAFENGKDVLAKMDTNNCHGDDDVDHHVALEEDEKIVKHKIEVVGTSAL